MQFKKGNNAGVAVRSSEGVVWILPLTSGIFLDKSFNLSVP